MVTHDCNPSTWEAESGSSLAMWWRQESGSKHQNQTKWIGNSQSPSWAVLRTHECTLNVLTLTMLTTYLALPATITVTCWVPRGTKLCLTLQHNILQYALNMQQLNNSLEMYLLNDKSVCWIIKRLWWTTYKVIILCLLQVLPKQLSLTQLRALLS